MASYLLLNYRDPKNKNTKNFAKPVVDIAASSRSWAQLVSWGYSLTVGLQTSRVWVLNHQPSIRGEGGLTVYMYDPKKTRTLVCCRLTQIYVDWYFIDSLIRTHEETCTDTPVL